MAEDASADVKYEDLGDAELDAFVEDTMKEFTTPGMAVLIVHGDKTYAKAYGHADIENGVNVTPQTLFQTGSTTKSFTSAMAAYLVESPDFPSISWDTPLASIIPEDFVLDQTTDEGVWATKRVTLEDALSHRTGMSRHDFVWINGDPTTWEIVRSLRHLPLHRELRKKFEYNNTMYTAVSHAVETVLDKPYKVLLKQHIYEPLGMDATSYTIPDALDLVQRSENIDLAKSYLWNEETNRYQQLPLTDIAPSKGSGGMISNVLDYSHWLRHLMRPTDLNCALSQNAVKEMRSPRTLVEPDLSKPYVGTQAYCLGLYSRVYRGKEIFSHSGASVGHMTTMLMIPSQPADGSSGRSGSDLGIVIFQNTWSPALDIVAWYLLDKFLETPEAERFDMAAAARKSRSTKVESMRPDNVVERLYASLNLDRSLRPSLDLDQFVGIYRHVAYHEFKISRPNSPETSHTLLLEPSGSQKSYFSLSATLHHVSGDWWWAHRVLGPSCWMTDEALKVFFVVDSNGSVTGMKLQAEPAMPDFLAFFEKVEEGK